MPKYAKFIAAVIGGACSTTVALFGADTTIGKVAAILLAACTAVAVFAIPNAPAEPPK